MPKRVIISQDYDGCYSIAAPGGIEAELNGRNKYVYSNPAYASLHKRLNQIPEQYQEYLTSITIDAVAVSVYVGSDRQSYELDAFNAKSNNNGSVFTALKTLCAERTTMHCQWTFEPALLADGEHPRGTALQRIESGSHVHLSAPLAKQFTDGKKASKIPMLLKQMQDAAHQYPNQEIEFHFIDDRDDLIEDIIKYLSPNKIPAGMTLKISKFDYVGLLQQEKGALGHVKSISSSHLSDAIPIKDTVKNYLDCLKKMISDQDVHLEYQNNRNIKFTIPEDSSPELSKLITRHNTIAVLYSQIKDKITLKKEDLDAAKKSITICCENKPSWCEKPFLQKLVSLLGMVFKPLYKAFASEEQLHQDGLAHRIKNHPAMGP